MGIVFTLSELIGLVGGFAVLSMAIVGFLIRRSVFGEIDVIKQNKQEKGFCGQQKLVCDQAITSLCDNVSEIKNDLKEGRKEFKEINRKMDRMMGKMNLRFDDINGNS